MKKLVVFIFLMSSVTGLFAQRKFKQKNPNLPYFEQSKFHFGFTLATNSSGFRIKYDLTAYDSLISLTTANQTGFNIGFLGSMRFNDNFTLRFLPTLAFAQRNLDYVFAGAEKNITDSRIIESTYVLFPFLIKYRSQRYNNFAAYMVAGGSFGLDLSSKFDVNNEVAIPEQLVILGRQSYFAEFGLGTDLFLEYFKFAIEFKYSHGLNNVFLDDGSFWAKPIKEIKPGMFTVSLLFEG